MLSYTTTYGLMLLYYCFFFKTVKTGYKKNSGQLKDILSGKGEPGILFTRLISGIFLLGFATVTLFEKRNVDLEIFTLAWDDYNTSVWIIIAAAIITGTLSAFKKIDPSNNSGHSLPSYLPLSFVLVRTLFLIVYESFFRGVMLFVMIEDLGVAVAVIVNLILYALLHWFDKKERVGSVLMGIILCSVSIYYYSVWPAIIIHLSLALSHEITLLINSKSLIKKSLS
jgi:membrane protease YdiL (CAAX protease family)